MVINHFHFHRAIFGGTYTEILKALSTKNNIPYLSPLVEKPDSNAITHAKNSKEVFPVKQRIKYQTQKTKSQIMRQNQKMK